MPKTIILRSSANGKREPRRSYLSELRDIAQGSGRRISAICQLRVEDLRLESHTEHGPFGAIRWPAATDKQGRETLVPMSPLVRDSVKRALAGRAITAGYLFPMPTNPGRPITKDRARRWLLQAEKLAGLEHLDRGAWHPFRRGFATARKHLPLTDLTAAGGWKGTETLTRCYLAPDADTMLKVVLGGGELREVREA